MKKNAIIAAVVCLGLFLTVLVVLWKSEPRGRDRKQSAVYAGLRRSSYGLPQKNKDDAWWVMRAKEFAASVSAIRPAQPVITEIVAMYLDEGTCRMEFEKPSSYTGDTPRISFKPNAGIDHEQALTMYDQAGVSAIIQFEPGNADVLTCLDIAYRKFGHHPCIIGYGIDAEWYCTKESADNTGIPLKDADVEKWVAKVRSFGGRQTLFLKHWNPLHMPPAFRHENLWFLSDSQNFDNFGRMMEDFTNWGSVYQDRAVGFQIGYTGDYKWWKSMNRPAYEISARILNTISNTAFLFWVDFTADKVIFPAATSGIQPN